MTESTRAELIVPGPAEALANLLGVPLPDLDAGEGLPLFWHWVYLLERPSQRDLGDDGHPVRGTIPAPPGPNHRRMFAGGHVRSSGRLRCGAAATRHSRVIESQEKKGRTGTLTFVTVEHQIIQDGKTVVAERQDIVYRELASYENKAPCRAANAGSPTRLTEQHTGGTEWSMDVTPTLLFRFSALTYNAHRIHYDRDYAREVEGYPGLVTHGPLQVLAMSEAARINGAADKAAVRGYRLTAPLFDHQGLIANAFADGETRRATVRDVSSRQTAHATIVPHRAPTSSTR